MLILKSASPRRKQILENMHLNFRIEPSNTNENFKENELPLRYLERVSAAKLDIQNAKSGSVYIASDTIVVLNNRILSKPMDVQEGLAILTQLSGKKHSVFSSIAIYAHEELFYDFDETLVEFKPWGDRESLEYLEVYKPFDKAGSYGIQDKDGPVLGYQGSYTNVMGFPLRKFYKYFEIWKEFLS